jgi:hypothetical protein
MRAAALCTCGHGGGVRELGGRTAGACGCVCSYASEEGSGNLEGALQVRVMCVNFCIGGGVRELGGRTAGACECV